MADYAVIAAAGRSIERMLNAAFEEEEPVDGSKTRAVLVRTSDFEPNAVATSIGSPALSIFFYRVDFNKTMRAAWSAIGSQEGRGRLAVDLHFLITPWADNSEFELRIIGKAMQCLETTPILSGPMLHPSAAWSANESIQVVMEEITTEAVMRTFDSLPTDYRLSVPYLARIARIDSRQAQPDTPVTTLVTGAKPGVGA
jgi:hypothetical protein